MNGTVSTRLDPGSRTIALTGLAPNCTVDGPASRIVTIANGEVAEVGFAIVCAATTGVIGVIVSGSPGWSFEVMVDGARTFFAVSGGRAYEGGVPAGDHVISMRAPTSCSVESSPQTITVTTGTMIRDTVEVTFSVTCEGAAFLFTAPTTGTIPRTAYSVGRCAYLKGGCTFEDGVILLGRVAPNGTLPVQVNPRTYRFRLYDLPPNCFISRLRNPTGEITIEAGEVRTITFPVSCG